MEPTIYSRTYDIDFDNSWLDPYPNKRDTILDELGKICISMSEENSGQHGSGGGTFILHAGNSTTHIKVPSTGLGQYPVIQEYDRILKIQTSPPSAQLPKKLIDLLKKKGFKLRKGKELEELEMD